MQQKDMNLILGIDVKARNVFSCLSKYYMFPTSCLQNGSIQIHFGICVTTWKIMKETTHDSNVLTACSAHMSNLI